MDKARLEIGSVPVRIAARVYGRDPAWVRAGIIAGWLPIGEATRNGKRITDVQQMNSKLGRISYYISPKLLYEQTGYEWRGEKRAENVQSCQKRTHTTFRDTGTTS
mgnify:CR=1 FL=1